MPDIERDSEPHFAADTGKRVLRLQHGEGREALIRAVVRVVAQKGLSGLSNRAVAQEAGVTHGLVHYHFGTGDKMLIETMSWVVEHAVTTLGLLPDPADADGDPIAHFAEALANLSDEDRQAHLFANELILASCRQKELRKVTEPVFDSMLGSIGNTLAAAGIEPTPARIRVVLAAINGLTVQHLFFGSAEESREASHELRALIEPLRSESPAASKG